MHGLRQTQVIESAGDVGRSVFDCGMRCSELDQFYSRRKVLFGSMVRARRSGHRLAAQAAAAIETATAARTAGSPGVT
jgi:hypothetical protein